MTNTIKMGKYRHYKGNEYQLIGVAKHSETLEELIIYKALYGDRAYWVRPKDMFFEFIEHNGKSMPRFEYLGE